MREASVEIAPLCAARVAPGVPVPAPGIRLTRTGREEPDFRYRFCLVGSHSPSVPATSVAFAVRAAQLERMMWSRLGLAPTRATSKSSAPRLSPARSALVSSAPKDPVVLL